jgi:hypothetical protein
MEEVKLAKRADAALTTNERMTSPPPNFELAAPIPSLLWDGLEQALKSNVRKLIREVATAVGQPDGPLQEAVLGKGCLIRPYLFEEANSMDLDPAMRCSYLCQRPDAPVILQECGQPVLWSAAAAADGRAPRCPHHCFSKGQGTTSSAGLTQSAPIEKGGTNCDDPLFATHYGAVYDGTQCRGRYSKATGRLTLFEVEEGEAAEP